MTTESLPKIDPARTALLVMDYQNGILGMFPDGGESLLATVRDLIDTVRGHGGTIGYVRVAFADGELEGAPETARMAKMITPDRAAMFHADAATTQVHDSIAPQPGDIVVRKTRVGAFGTTDLDAQLKARGIDTLLLAGISTGGVVLSTVIDGHDRDYRLLVLEQAVADPDPEMHDFLIKNVLSKRADVISVADLHDLLH